MAVGPVVFAKLLAQPARLDAHHGINGGVEGLRTVEDLQSDVVALKTPAGQSFVDDKFQEPLPSRRVLERNAVEDAVQLLANSLLISVAPTHALNDLHYELRNEIARARCQRPSYLIPVTY